MKITVEIDCEPAEAREFMGLPNLEPLQQAFLENMGEQMRTSFGTLDPESFMKMWMPFAAQNMQNLENLQAMMFPSADQSERETSSSSSRSRRSGR